MSTVKNYLSLIRFSHTIFAMPFAMIGFALGVYPVIGHLRTSVSPLNITSSPLSGWHTVIYPLDPQMPHSIWQILVKLLLVIGCMIFARRAAMAFNRDLDG